MNRLMVTVAALAMLGAPAAFAQQGGGQGQDHHGGQGGGQPQGHAQGGQQHGGPPGQGQGRAGPPQPGGGHPPVQGRANGQFRQGQGGPPQQGGQHPPFQGQANGQFRHGQGAPPQQGGARPAYQGQARGQFRGPQNAPDRYRAFQRNVQAQRRFRIGTYAWPRGRSYRRWTFGQVLPPVFFGQNYWIGDYGAYGLPYPPPGAVWVRYGPDALLVDQDTGEIIQVIYGIFY